MKHTKKITAIVVAFVIVLSLATAITASATNNADTPVESGHICPITKANENSHRVECDECGESYRVYHDEENMKLNCKNAFFHEYSCDCGYSYTVEHDFDTAFNANVHYDVCIDCGYTAADEAHEMVNYFDGNYHYIECEYCWYTAEQHIGVKYEAVDKNACVATCSDCGSTETVEHDWDGFICENCGYALNGEISAVVYSIREREDYRVCFKINEQKHYINLEMIDFNEGDVVEINIFDNDIIEEINVVIEYQELMENFNNPEYVISNDVHTGIINEIIYDEITLGVKFSNNTSCYFINYEIHDFKTDEIVDESYIFEGERLVWFYFNNKAIIYNYYN